MKNLHYTFSVEYAERYGLNEAIMLHNFIYWININKANKNNFINDKYWTYNSSKAFQKLFPFWTQKQIEYTLSKLVDAGILIKDCFNEDKRDRTAWYTLSDSFFSDCISEKKEMDTTNLGNDISEKKEIIYITDKKQQMKNTNENNINTHSLSQSNSSKAPTNSVRDKLSRTQKQDVELKSKEDDLFEAFWEKYPIKKAKEKARQKFKSLLSKTKDKEMLVKQIMEGLELYNQDIQQKQTKKEFIAHPSTWLNQERWKDEYEATTSHKQNQINLLQNYEHNTQNTRSRPTPVYYGTDPSNIGRVSDDDFKISKS